MPEVKQKVADDVNFFSFYPDTKKRAFQIVAPECPRMRLRLLFAEVYLALCIAVLQQAGKLAFRLLARAEQVAHP